MTCTRFQFSGFFVLPSLTLTNGFDDRTGTPSSGLRCQADLCRQYHPDSRCRSSCREYVRLSMWSFQCRFHFLRLGQTQTLLAEKICLIALFRFAK
jgi:hypothetical protein